MSGSGKRRSLAGESEQELYRKLPKIVHSKLQLPPAEAALEDEVKGLMTELVEKTESNVEAVLKSKLQGKVLLLDNTIDASTPRGASKEHTSHGPPQLRHTRKMKDKQGFFNLPPDACKYAKFLPLHELWKQYMQNALQYEDARTTSMVMNQALVKADLHGCYLTVVKSRRPSLVGQAGIVVQETENTFRVITEADSIKVFPKADSVFSFVLGKYTFSIFGNHFRLKPVDRAARKAKAKATIDL